MTLKPLLLISAAATATLVFSACNESVPYGEEMACTPSCDENTAISCDENGNEIRTDCGNDKVCNSGKCIENSKPTVCEQKCDENTAITCDENGNEVRTDCGNDKVCNSGKCIEKSEPTVCEQKCDENTAITCDENGNEVRTDCGDDKICDAGECKEKSEPTVCEQKCDENTAISCDENGNEVRTDCGDDKICDAGECKEKQPECSAKCDENTAISCDENGNEIRTDCGDDKICDAGECKEKQPECSAKCDENTAISCDENGNEVKTECTGNLICLEGACVEDPTPKCDVNAPKVCNSPNSYLMCDGGTEKNILCDDHMICDNGECIPECNDSDPVVCNDSTSVKSCKQGVITIDPCGDKMACIEGECKADDSSKPNPNSLIGKSCTCTGDDCKIQISGAEVKNVLTIAPLLELMGIVIKDEETIVAPNYFSQNITGCEGLVAPEGMAVGCMLTDQISFPPSISGLPDQLSSLLGLLDLIDLGDIGIDMGSLDLDGIVNAIKPILTDGINFKANKGYCILADIDLNMSITDEMISELFDTSSLNTLVDRINTPGHDHEKAKLTTCPEGSTLLTFGLDSTSEKGVANVGFDICLKTCDTDNDCNTADGYSCIDMPRNQADIENKTTSARVCFDKANIDYFEAMTETFEGLFPKEEGETPAE